MATVLTPSQQEAVNLSNARSSAQYVTNQNGQTTTQISNGNTVAKDSVFDPLSPNFKPSTISGNYQNPGTGSNQSSASPTLASSLQSLVQPYQSYQASTPSVTDNSNLISQMYASQLTSAQDALKKSIQQSMGQYQDTITQAPQTYQPLRDQASAAGYQNLNSLKETLANNGQQGGVNRTETTAVNSATENNINKLNLQQQNVIDAANKSIADLQASGDIQGAQLVAQNATDKIKALIDESNRVSSTGYQYSQDAIKNAMNEATLTGNYNGQQTLTAKNSALQNAFAEAGVTGTYNGTQTVASKQADASIANTNANTDTTRAQLAEITNPDSVTNQLARLNLDTAKLNYAALPDQLQSKAQLIAQQLASGAISIQTAQTQLDALPAQQQASLGLTQAQTSAANRSNTSSGSSTKAPTTAEIGLQQTIAQNNAVNAVNALDGQGWDETSIIGAMNEQAQSNPLIDMQKLLQYIKYDRYQSSTK